MSTTAIEWTDVTWNPTRGCSRVSEGCRHCYAELQAARNLPGSRSPTTGEAFAILNGDGPHWTGKVELIESKLTEPLHWRKPRRVFVNSMSDLFHEALPFSNIALVYASMLAAPHHEYQILTKRPQRRIEFFQWLKAVAESHRRTLTMQAATFSERQLLNFLWLRAGGPCAIDSKLELPAKHIWEGVSVEDQATADERIPKLLETPAALRFVSYEPALEQVVFDADWLWPRCHYCGRHSKRNLPQCEFQDCVFDFDGSEHRLLDWGIVGGESGPQARPCDLGWIESTIDQFKAAGVPLFVKQVGSRSGYQRMDGWHDRTNLGPKNSKGGDWEDWPDKIRVREFPR